ncbi:MAG TPA: FAD-binding protein [Candidatus Limiplasma sp.]|nr:FAD-binding protein [Candidatus Limiplasma sp.]HPS81501.1 FAD-binding protein [Candidatus Limiplasma sp.]
MLRLHQIRLPLSQADSREDLLLRRLAAERLQIPVADVTDAAVAKRSIDARDRGDVHYTLTLDVRLRAPEAEAALLRRFQPNQAVRIADDQADASNLFTLDKSPYGDHRPRPIVIGAGPAGLFCALALAARGAKPLLLERGKPVEARARDVALMEAQGQLDPDSNVLFGEGGAGAFSDGKLTCRLNDPAIRVVLQTLVECGAPKEILISARPHIGTDLLRGVLAEIRRRLMELGGTVWFENKVTGIALENGHVSGVTVKDRQSGATVTLETDAAYLAIGHSARDTYAWLQEMGVPMQAKPFAIGVRIEHPQAEVNRAQYGAAALTAALPSADYKLNAPTPDGRGVYTFCMCPGGQVINASSEPGLLNVNGMSQHARDGENANAALLVGVSPADYGSDHPLAGIELQRKIERAAFAMGDGYRAPCQRVGDFLAGKPSAGFGGVKPSYRPGVFPADIALCLPDFITQNLRLALPLLGRRLRGFDQPDALLTAPETRSSSPVRILRDERRQSAIRGLYPLGEGAGYAGGIVSAAVDGLKAALDA